MGSRNLPHNKSFCSASETCPILDKMLQARHGFAATQRMKFPKSLEKWVTMTIWYAF
jgi:hypothetical protein